MIITLLQVAAGGALGAGARYLVNVAAMRALGPGFPWGTLIVNVAGSFAMGLLVALLAFRLEPAPGLRLFLVTGVLGGFTTFSAFSLDAVTLYERGAPAAAGGYVLASVALAIAGLAAGLALGRAVLT